MGKSKKSSKKIIPASPGPAAPRYPRLDEWRGFAVALMLGYHFCYDLVYFRWVYFDFQGSPFWLSLRALILGLFLLLVGVSLYLAHTPALRPRPWLRRWVWLLVCAALVSAGSYGLFPQRYIFFGVLHCIALASLLALPLLRLGWWNALLGSACVALGGFWLHPWFDQAAWQWLGLMSHKPATEDYVPLLPWFGVVLWGLALAPWLSRQPWFSRVPAAPGRAPAALAWLGRHSLAVYMLHQPLLLGGLYGLVYWPLRLIAKP